MIIEWLWWQWICLKTWKWRQHAEWSCFLPTNHWEGFPVSRSWFLIWIRSWFWSKYDFVDQHDSKNNKWHEYDQADLYKWVAVRSRLCFSRISAPSRRWSCSRSCTRSWDLIDDDDDHRPWSTWSASCRWRCCTWPGQREDWLGPDKKPLQKKNFICLTVIRSISKFMITLTN